MAGDTQGSSSQTFWEGYKEFWSDRFSFLGNYSKFIKRDKPLASWSNNDVEEFIASDPVHGPVLRTTREAVQYGLTGSALGALFTAGFAWKYSRSLHGAGLSFWLEVYLGGHLGMKSQIIHFNFTGSTHWLLRLSFWSGGKGRPKEGIKAVGFWK